MDNRDLRLAEFIWDIETDNYYDKYESGFYYWLKTLYEEMKMDLAGLGDSVRLLFVMLLSLKLY